MGFREIPQEPLLQAPLGTGTVTVLGPQGLRLSGLGSFHLDEGPNFVWLNIYRTLANARELEITREREPASVEIDERDVVVSWASTEDVQAELSARYHIDEEGSAVDVTFSATAQADYRNFELFIANYFTPYYFPRYAVQDSRAHPEDIAWYEKRWFGEDENECWPRDEEVLEVFRDGRWLTGHALNWRIGPCYALPLTIQEHRYGHAIVLMARREDCIGVSGYNSYHNSQYFHLFGRDVTAGEELSTTIRMVLLTEWDDLQATAVKLHGEWANGGET